MIKYFLAIIFLLSAISSAQSNRYTKGAENGYSWKAMENPVLIYDNSKYNYLGEILERYKILKQNFPEIENFGCNDELNFLLESGKSKDILLDDMINAVDAFYSYADNLPIPIIFAYCYCIKLMADVSEDELNNYMNIITEFCKD